MRIGYACLTVGVRDTALKNCMLKNADAARLFEITEHNLDCLDNMLNYNIRTGIHLFRVSSDLIPFASRPDYPFSWQEKFSQKLKQLGDKALQNRIRLSMHPGQYTVLNSPNTEVVKNAISDLEYHCSLMDSMGLGSDSKIILHIGGIYQDKKAAIERFLIHYSYLSEAIKKRLIFENDDKSYHIADVLDIAAKLGAPVVFDNLHHSVNPCDNLHTDNFWINECKKTWKQTDGCQKMHYSQQEPSKKPGSHSSTIHIRDFLDYYNGLDSKDIDIMLEVKDKNLSAVKCILCTSDKKKIGALEDEWSKYKYSVLEKSPQDYLEIRKILKNKSEYPAVGFYELLEDALYQQTNQGEFINALHHVWGYFKNTATEKEKASFIKMTANFEQGNISEHTIKNYLLKLAVKYQQDYLLNSYYFDL